MRALLCLALSGCLFAPSRPPDVATDGGIDAPPIPPGTPLQLDQPGCLAGPGSPMTATVVGAAPDGNGDALWRAQVDDLGLMHVYAFLPTRDLPGCFATGFQLPGVQNAELVALDSSRLGGGEIVVAALGALGTSRDVTVYEIVIAGGTAILTAPHAAGYAIMPPAVANAEQLPFRPRFLRRLPDGLWFGGGTGVSRVTESQPGVITGLAFGEVTGGIPSSESWLDAADGILVGERDLCAVDAALGCTSLLVQQDCDPSLAGDGGCHITTTGAPHDIAPYVAYAAYQENVDQPFYVALAQPGTPTKLALDIPNDGNGWGQDVTMLPISVAPDHELVALWYPDGGPTKVGELVRYLGADSATDLVPLPTTTPAPGWGDDTALYHGVFSGVAAVLVVGDDPVQTACFAVGSQLEPCTP